jgi:predicted transcriptional regulator
VDLPCPPFWLPSVRTIESEAGDSPLASAKQLVLEVLQALPDDCTVEDIQYELYVRQKVVEGERAADAGQVVPHEDVIREAREWLDRL